MKSVCQPAGRRTAHTGTYKSEGKLGMDGWMDTVQGNTRWCCYILVLFDLWIGNHFLSQGSPPLQIRNGWGISRIIIIILNPCVALKGNPIGEPGKGGIKPEIRINGWIILERLLLRSSWAFHLNWSRKFKHLMCPSEVFIYWSKQIPGGWGCCWSQNPSNYHSTGNQIRIFSSYSYYYHPGSEF